MSADLRTLASIGVFDSGVGGISVMRAIRQEYPREAIIYLADQAHVPYGNRTMNRVRDYAEGITQYLLGQDSSSQKIPRVKLIVVACNTASAAALHYLRQTFPDIPFVGMEPAVKPAAENTRTGTVGVLATPATFLGALYASVVERFANGVNVIQHTCPGLVAQIENGELETKRTRAILEDALHPMLDQGIDTVVLGCTHYPFVIPLIQDIVGPEVRVIDPSPAVARQVGRMLDTYQLRCLFDEGDSSSSQGPTQDQNDCGSGSVLFFTMGDPARLESLLPQFVSEVGDVQQLRWVGGRLG